MIIIEISLNFQIGVCLVSAKYLPDESNNFKQLLSRHKRSDSEDSFDDSNSNETGDDSDEETKEQSKVQARIEKMRLKLLEIQEKEKRKQEEAQRKIEEKIAKELKKEEEKRVKEEEKRQKELQKREEKLEKERKKLEEEQQKIRERVLKNEQKRQKTLQKQLEEREKNRLKLQEDDNISLEFDTDESSDLEDFWKNYIYSKYGINESDSDLEKKTVLRRYMHEELGLNVNSTTSERRQAVFRLVESKLQTVSDQYALQSKLIDFVNRVGVQKIRAQLEKEIEELNNKTDILNNVNLPWVSVAKEQFEEQLTFLQTIKEFLSSILPNWFNENVFSSEPKLNKSLSPNEQILSVKSLDSISSMQNENISESSLINSNGDNDESKLNINNLSDGNSSALFSNSPDDSVSSLGNNNNIAPESTISNIDNNSILSKTSESFPYEDASAKHEENSSSSNINVNEVSNVEKSVTPALGVSNLNTISKTITGSVSDTGSDLTDAVKKAENEEQSNGSIAHNISSDSLLNEKDTLYEVQSGPTDPTLDNNKQESILKNEPNSDGLSGIQDSLFNTVSTDNTQKMDNVNLIKAINAKTDSSINQVSISTPSANELLNDINPLLPTTQRSQLNVISKTADAEIGIDKEGKPTDSLNVNSDSVTDDVLNSNSLLPNDVFNTNPINSQDNTSPTSSNFETTNKNNLVISDTNITVKPGSTTEVITASSEAIPSLVNAVINYINGKNYIAIPSDSNIKNAEASTDDTFLLNITSPNNSENSGIKITEPNIDINFHQKQITSSELAKTDENVLLDNSQPQNVTSAADVTTEQDTQSLNQLVGVSRDLNAFDKDINFGDTYSIDNDHILPTDSVITNVDAHLSSVTPGTFGTEKVEQSTAASEGSNTLNSNFNVAQNASTNFGEIVSDNEVTEYPVTLADTLTSITNQSSTVSSDGRQEKSNTEEQYMENNVTMPNTEENTVTETTFEEILLESTISPESGNNELIKNQEKPYDGITVPIEYGASVVDIAN